LRRPLAILISMAKKPALTVVESASTYPKPPRKLGAHGADLWRNVQREYEIKDIGGIELLVQCCLAVDRAEACRAIIDSDGESMKVKGEPRAHPLLRDELANRAFVTRCLARLGLNFEALKPSVGRPPGTWG
jgi:hypothetical protein